MAAFRRKYIQVSTTRHGRQTVYFRRDKHSPRFRMPDDMSSPEFEEAYATALLQERVDDVRHDRPTPYEVRYMRSAKSIQSAFRSARTRARAKGLPFTITIDEMMDRAVDQKFCCFLSGIEFFAKDSGERRVSPYTPSIDRITPSLGYVPSNVRLVILAVNIMILDWGDELFMRIANSHRFWQRTKDARSNPVQLEKYGVGKE